MISWEEYVKANVLKFREEYEKLSERRRKFLKEDRITRVIQLNKPSQIVVVESSEPPIKCLIVAHNKEYPDIETTVYKNVALENVLKEPKLLELCGNKAIEEITVWIRELKQIGIGWDISLRFLEEAFLLAYGKDPRSSPYPLHKSADIIIDYYDHHLRILEQREKIDQTVSTIKKDAEEIPVIELKTKILEATERLDGQIKQLDEQHGKLKEEVVGVRKLIGTETFGEWKVLLSEIDKVNTRIDALSDIKDAYDKLFAQQDQFMKQQSEVMKQQSSLLNWVKYSMILVPIVVACVPIIEVLIRHLLGTP